jgi:hypothetical protein
VASPTPEVRRPTLPRTPVNRSKGPSARPGQTPFAQAPARLVHDVEYLAERGAFRVPTLPLQAHPRQPLRRRRLRRRWAPAPRRPSRRGARRLVGCTPPRAGRSHAARARSRRGGPAAPRGRYAASQRPGDGLPVHAAGVLEGHQHPDLRFPAAGRLGWARASMPRQPRGGKGLAHPPNGPGSATFRATGGRASRRRPKRATSEAISESAAVLSSTPSAPASAIRPRSPGSMLAVSTSTLTEGLASRRTATRPVPSPSGRKRSSSATSTVRSKPPRARHPAREPHWATTFMPGRRSSRSARALRKAAWSSTSSRRSNPFPPDALGHSRGEDVRTPRGSVQNPRRTSRGYATSENPLQPKFAEFTF